MNEQRREELYNIAKFFDGKPVTQDAIVEYCNKHNYEPITTGELEDSIAQVNHDEKVTLLTKDILQLLTRYIHIKEYAPVIQRKQAYESNEKLEIEIAQLFEKYELKYHFVSLTSENLAQAVMGIIQRAGNRIFNKATSVMFEITKEKFGKDFDTGHVKKFWDEKYGVESKEETES